MQKKSSKLKTFTKENWWQLLLLSTILVFFCFLFSRNIVRIFYSIIFFGESIGCYFRAVFLLQEDVRAVLPLDYLIAQSGGTLTSILPFNWEAFVQRLSLMWPLLTSGDFYSHLGSLIGNDLLNLLRILTILVPVFLIYRMATSQIKVDEESRDEDSKPLAFYKRKIDPIIYKVSCILKKFFSFFKRSYTKWFFIFYVGLALNLFPVLFDTFSEYFYIISSLDFNSLWKYVLTALIDLSPIILSLNLIGWILLIWIIKFTMEYFRCHKVLKHCEELNDEFLANETANIVCISGASGVKKTATLTDMTQTALMGKHGLYNKLLSIMDDCSGTFSMFPWHLLEKEIREQNLFNEYRIVKYLKSLRNRFEKKKDSRLLFGYDFERFGLYKYDGLVKVNLFQYMYDYAVAYIYYTTPSALAMSNYAISISMGKYWKEGFFPLYSVDYFKEKLEDFEKRCYSKVMDFDYMRMGRKFDEENIPDFIPTIAIHAYTEFDKERDSYANLQKKNGKGRDVNQNNDEFITTLKIYRHKAELHHVCLFKIFYDLQYLKDINPGVRNQTETMCLIDRYKVKQVSALKAYKPLRFVEDKLLSWWSAYKAKKKHETNTYLLRIHIGNWFFGFITMHMKKMDNLTTVYVLPLQVQNGATPDESADEKYWYLSTKKAYAGRYETTYLKTLAIAQMKDSTKAFGDLEAFTDLDVSTDEMRQMHSFFYHNILNTFAKQSDGSIETEGGEEDDDT